MAEFDGILPFFSNVIIAYRGGEWDGQQDGVARVGWEVAKVSHLGHKGSGSKLFVTLHWCHCSTFRVDKMSYRKADQLTFNT